MNSSARTSGLLRRCRRRGGAWERFAASCRTLIVLLRQDDVTHVAVAFDHVIESFRNRLFDGYKTGEGIAEELLAQFDPAEIATEALGIVTWPMTEFEADDAIATAAMRFADDPRVEQVVICSPDKDLMQVVRGDRIVSLDRRREILTNEAGVEEKFGVPPESIPDYLALVGDSADGIPGVPRWGAKGASTLLARYGRIESIPDSEMLWGREGAGRKEHGEYPRRASGRRRAVQGTCYAPPRRSARREP